jgi:hypothetical protein
METMAKKPRQSSSWKVKRKSNEHNKQMITMMMMLM